MIFTLNLLLNFSILALYILNSANFTGYAIYTNAF